MFDVDDVDDPRVVVDPVTDAVFSAARPMVPSNGAPFGGIGRCFALLSGVGLV